MSSEKIQAYTQELLDAVIRFLPRIVLAIVILIIGFWLINWFAGFVRRSLERRQFDLTLRTFLKSAVSIGLKILLLIMVAGMLGVQTSSFVAVIGAMGLAIGLALQGSLSNFAGGFLIILFKPYVVGEFVEINGKTGTVREIQIFNTLLMTPEGHLVILPNGQASNNTIINFTRNGIRRGEIALPFPIEADVELIRRLTLQLIHEDERVLKEPAPLCVLQHIGPGDITLAVRYHVAVDQFFPVTFALREGILGLMRERKIRFDDDAERIVLNPEQARA